PHVNRHVRDTMIATHAQAERNVVERESSRGALALLAGLELCHLALHQHLCSDETARGCCRLSSDHAGHAQLLLAQQFGERHAIDDDEAVGLLESGGELCGDGLTDVPPLIGAVFASAAEP